jgi:hypothetical protein
MTQPACGDGRPEDHAGAPVDDGWDDDTEPLSPGRPYAEAATRKEVSDGGVDSGALPGRPAV